ncbi:MAG: UbiA family prenyltransferase [Bacteroidia bacterium]|nr:UbiA family prenyltransferase [Bacteroidia bacterium]
MPEEKTDPLRRIKNYLSLVKFSHTIFALPFALIGFIMGAASLDFQIDWWNGLYVLLCMIFARSAAMSFNRYIDRDIDIQNPRTATREIPSGKIAAKSALQFTIINSILFVSVAWLINPLCFYLSPIALSVILGYSYTKRFTSLCHFVLGVGLSLAPIGAFIAVTGEFAVLPILFSFAVLFWVSGFDIIYALQDEQFDMERDLRSIPVLLGKKNALLLSTVLHIACAVVLLLAGFKGESGWYYWIGWLIFSILLTYQHLLVKPNDLSKVNLAFFTTNGIASIAFAIFYCADFL